MELFIILSVGYRIDIEKELNNIPSNFIVKKYVSQLDVLSKTDVFITQGGMNSVHEALYYDVPMVVAPQHPEQQMVGERVEATKTGILLKSVTPETLKSVVETVLGNDTYKANAIKQGESFKSAGGFKRAADEIIKYKQAACLSS